MFFSNILTTLLVSLPLLGLSSAQMVPTSPDGNTILKMGSQGTAMWSRDTTGEWNQVTVQLMSGDNFNMIPVTTLTTTLDATSPTANSYTFTVPRVNPASKIYFLQFTPTGSTNISEVTWTTRFTIANADGTTTAPANSVQPNGASIPWGVGSLADGSSTSSNSTLVSSVNGTNSNAVSSNATAAALPATSASSSSVSLAAASNDPSTSTLSMTRTAPISTGSSSSTTRPSAAVSSGAAVSGRSLSMEVLAGLAVVVGVGALFGGATLFGY